MFYFAFSGYGGLLQEKNFIPSPSEIQRHLARLQNSITDIKAKIKAERRNAYQSVEPIVLDVLKMDNSVLDQMIGKYLLLIPLLSREVRV